MFFFSDNTAVYNCTISSMLRSLKTLLKNMLFWNDNLLWAGIFNSMKSCDSWNFLLNRLECSWYLIIKPGWLGGIWKTRRLMYCSIMYFWYFLFSSWNIVKYRSRRILLKKSKYGLMDIIQIAFGIHIYFYLLLLKVLKISWRSLEV